VCFEPAITRSGSTTGSAELRAWSFDSIKLAWRSGASALIASGAFFSGAGVVRGVIGAVAPEIANGREGADGTGGEAIPKGDDQP